MRFLRLFAIFAIFAKIVKIATLFRCLRFLRFFAKIAIFAFACKPGHISDVGTAMEENISPAGFSRGDDDISDSFSVDLISIKEVLIKNVMLRKVMLILSKIRGILNKVVMWNIVGVM